MDINILDNPVPPTIPDLEEILKGAFPDYKITKPLLNSRMILVQKGMVMAVVRLKGDAIRVKGGLNSQHIGILLGIALGVIFGFIGALFILLGLYAIYHKQAKELEIEVSDFLKDYLAGGNRDISGLV